MEKIQLNGEKFKSIRLKKGYSRNSLAKEIGYKVANSIQVIELEEVLMPYDKYVKAKQILGFGDDEVDAQVIKVDRKLMTPQPDIIIDGKTYRHITSFKAGDRAMRAKVTYRRKKGKEFDIKKLKGGMWLSLKDFTDK